MNRHSSAAFALTTLLVWPLHSEAYKELTHALISESAANRSVLRDQNKLNQLGLLYPIASDAQKFPNQIQGDELAPNGDASILNLIKGGAIHEDADPRALNHFFDPLNNAPLTILGFSFFANSSPDWALEDNGSIQSQDNSYKDARQYLFYALTASTKPERDASWGLTFRSLGQVIHHLQDMAQPQHVRNDAHLDKYSKIVGLPNPLYNPSEYEIYTHDKDVQPNLPYAVGYPDPDLPYQGLNLAIFDTPRKFWTEADRPTDGRGLAQFTNYNFFSAGSNLNKHKYDSPGNRTSLQSVEDIQALCANAVPVCPNQNLTGQMSFYGNYVEDRLTGQSSFNSRATTESLFDQKLMEKGKQPVYTLNRFNFAAAHSYLIPRAVAYSASLMNYFFRGQMEISLPDEGAYSILDHATPSGNDPQTGGFSLIKVKLKNATPSSDPNQPIEPMTAGAAPILVAVAKFHRNRCYQANLSGEYGSPGVAWDRDPNDPTRPCRDPVEEIVVSERAAVPVGINVSEQPVTFDFSQHKIPISATDLFLQIVYRGPLGQESDAVVVATKDISEPSYRFNYSHWDQFVYCGTWPTVNTGSSCPNSYAQWCAPAFTTLEACNFANGTTDKWQFGPDTNFVSGYDPATYSVPEDTVSNIQNELPLTPSITMVAPVGTMTRTAVLLDAVPANKGLIVSETHDPEHDNHVFLWLTGRNIATTNQLEHSTNTLTPSVTYRLARGIYAPEVFYQDLTSHTAPTVPDLVIVPSQINFH